MLNTGDYLTTKELAKHFNVSVSTIRRLLREGSLTAYQRTHKKENFFKLSEAEQVLALKPKRP